MKAINTYLVFNGNCREAMTFYSKCLGGDLHMLPFEQMPSEQQCHEDAKGRIMHAKLVSGAAVLMASDTMPSMPFQKGNNFSVCLDCESMEEIDRLFSALGENGKVTLALHDSFWGARFGMLIDQFGISWMFNAEKPKS